MNCTVIPHSTRQRRVATITAYEFFAKKTKMMQDYGDYLGGLR
jgi:hypothetical protein